MHDRRVAVTGIGLMSSLGTNRDQVWQGLVEGRCGIGELTLFDRQGYRSTMVAEIPPFGAEQRFTAGERRRLSRSDQVAVVASAEALADSDLLASGISPYKVGVLFGSGTNDLLRNEDYYAEVVKSGIGKARPSLIFNHFTSNSIDVVGRRFGLKGLRAATVSACSSATVAIGYGGDLIRAGLLDAAVVGGCDVLCRLTLSGFNALRLVSQHPCRPFDTARDGLNIGEASAILILEEWERARRRGATIYAELAGYAARCEAYHPTAPEPQGRAVAAMLEAALRAAKVDASEIDHVNAHGTATPYNDLAEARGINVTFGARGKSIPVTSIKSMVGHCLGAAGAIEAAVTALTLHHGVIPPTIHHDETDPKCDVDVVAKSARKAYLRAAVSTSLAFGGNDAAVVFRHVA